mgnify:CR=1 FL=1
MVATILMLIIIILGWFSPYVNRWAEKRAAKDMPLEDGEVSEVLQGVQWEASPDTGEIPPETLMREMEADFPERDEDVSDKNLSGVLGEMLVVGNSVREESLQMESGEMVAFVLLSPVSDRWVRLTTDEAKRKALAYRWLEDLKNRKLHLFVLHRGKPGSDEDRGLIGDLLGAQQNAAMGGDGLGILALCARDAAATLCRDRGRYRSVAVTWKGVTGEQDEDSPLMYILAEDVSDKKTEKV